MSPHKRLTGAKVRRKRETTKEKRKKKLFLKIFVYFWRFLEAKRKARPAVFRRAKKRVLLAY